eukprot:5112283-Alexandrium_andersonii.AAC.1
MAIEETPSAKPSPATPSSLAKQPKPKAKRAVDGVPGKPEEPPPKKAKVLLEPKGVVLPPSRSWQVVPKCSKHNHCTKHIHRSGVDSHIKH